MLNTVDPIFQYVKSSKKTWEESPKPISISEGLGNSILEPMACQCPVVSSDTPGKNEIIVHQSNGMLYELGDINKGAACAEKLLRDIPFRNTIIRNASSTIQSNYNQDVYVDRYLGILSKI